MKESSKYEAFFINEEQDHKGLFKYRIEPIFIGPYKGNNTLFIYGFDYDSFNPLHIPENRNRMWVIPKDLELSNELLDMYASEDETTYLMAKTVLGALTKQSRDD